MPPTISVVLATFNGEAFLEKQLASLACQSKAPLELIVSDDGSTDRTNDIIDRFRQTAPFPVIHRKNPVAKGFRENFLAAAGLASGDWISFCDQDDVWREDKLEVCARHMTQQGVTQIVHQATLIDEDDWPLGSYDQGIVATAVKAQLAYDVWSTFWGFSMLVDRRILGLVPPDQRFVDYIDDRHLIAHDRWAFFLGQTLGKTVEIAEPLAAYRQHGKNIYGKSTGRLVKKTVEALKAENAVYVAATRKMLQLVEAMPADTGRDFPCFDRKKAVDVYERALRQLQGRGAVYDGNRISALFRSLAMLVGGGYRNAQDSSLRWRSFLRDVMVSVARR
ncbi:glycosyltransferase [Variovorax sp. J22R133]|uniref:glycosyltransferase n=1 Tax=Variovorax brevis TaxID=3053503 RepID=UPI0025758F9F|nr:glycosyltransferase [Variovorax sp. J22R133]MDM0113962.1 glycosyltransferase [Variovorax sp. J22R133]